MIGRSGTTDVGFGNSAIDKGEMGLNELGRIR